MNNQKKIRVLRRTDKLTAVLEDLAIGEQLTQKYKENKCNSVKVMICRLQAEGRGEWHLDTTDDVAWIATRIR